MKWNIGVILKDADAQKLLKELNITFPITGKVNAEGKATGQKGAPKLSGYFRVSDGVVGPIPTLEKLSVQTGIEPLRQLKFNEISGNASNEANDVVFKNIKILSSDARLLANIKLKPNGRINGALSAKFSEKALNDSSQLKWLMKFVGGQHWIDFDFKVAGSLASPRIEWLVGDFKRRIETKLPPFIRGMLIREIEKRMSAPAVER